MPAFKHKSLKEVLLHLKSKLPGFFSTYLAELRKFDHWLTAAEVDAAMASDGPPIGLHFEYLRNVSKLDALFYAQGFAASQNKSLLSWYGVFPLNDGFLVEVQDGGSGKAYGPALIEAYGDRVKDAGSAELPLLSAVIVAASGRGVMVEVTPSSVVTWTLPESDVAPVASGLQRTSQLALRRQADGLQQLRVALTVCASSFLVLGLSILFSPGAHEVTLLDDNLAVESPLQALDRPVPPDKRAVAVRYIKGEWTVELADRPVDTRPSLREKSKKANESSNAPVAPVGAAVESKEAANGNR